MDKLSMKDVATRVVAWHNRHPLARRITLGQVHGIGVVSLPCTHADEHSPATDTTVAAAGRWQQRVKSLADPVRRTLTRFRKPPSPPAADGAARLTTAFSEAFIDGLSTAQIARFTLRWGQSERPGEADWPQRDVRVQPTRTTINAEPTPPDTPEAPVDPASDATDITRLYLLTAAIDTDPSRPRLLIAADAGMAVLGARLWSRSRIIAAASAAVLCLSAVLLVIALLHVAARRSDAAKPAAPAAAASASTQAAASAPIAAAVAASAGAASASASASAPAEEAASGATAVPAAPSASASEHPAPQASSEASSPAASHAGQGDKPDKPNASIGTAASAQTTAAPAASAPPTGKYYALLSRGPRSHAEAEALLARVKAAAAALPEERDATQTEVMNIGGTWRTVWWPFPSRGAATTARWALALKGVTVDVVEF